MPKEGGFGVNNNLTRLSTEEAKRRGRLGGQAYARKIKAKKSTQEIFKACLKLKIQDVPTLKKAAKALGLTENDNLEAFITMSTMVNTAKKDDINVLESVMKYKGESLTASAKDIEQESAHAELMRALSGEPQTDERGEDEDNEN